MYVPSLVVLIFVGVKHLNGFTFARLIAYGAACFACRLAAGLAFAASGVATVVVGSLSDNLNMSHNMPPVFFCIIIQYFVLKIK